MVSEIQSTIQEELNAEIPFIEFSGGEVKIKLLCEEETLIPAFSGAIIRAAVLNFIKENDPELSSKLHESNERRPYALNTIRKVAGTKARTQRREMVIKTGDIIQFSIKVFSNQILEKIIKMFLTKEEQPTLNLLDIEYKIHSIELKKHGVSLIPPCNRVKVIFHTPTYFAMKSKPESMLFPEPIYLYMNIAKMWNYYNNQKGTIDEKELYEWVQKNVVVNDYSTRTRRVYLGKKVPIKGFEGWVVYRIKDTTFLPWIYLLTEYAKLTNVGGNRTAGMGIVSTKWLTEE